MSDERQQIEAAVRKAAGISALRRLHELLVEDRQQRASNARWVRRVFLLAGAAMALFLLWLGLHFTR